MPFCPSASDLWSQSLCSCSRYCSFRLSPYCPLTSLPPSRLRLSQSVCISLFDLSRSWFLHSRSWIGILEKLAEIDNEAEVHTKALTSSSLSAQGPLVHPFVRRRCHRINCPTSRTPPAILSHNTPRMLRQPNPQLCRPRELSKLCREVCVCLGQLACIS